MFARGGRILGRLMVGLIVFLVVGNAAILAASTWYRSQAGARLDVEMASVENFRVVDERLWRGAAPGGDGLRELAAAGVTTVVDLRAEGDLEIDDDLIASLGLTRLHLPIRDGQVPTPTQVDAFLRTIDTAEGTVFVHCGAGVGRTGVMAAAYLTSTGTSSGAEAMRVNLSVGPPSLEQIAFARGLDGGYERPSALVTGMSRVLDAPRRMWHTFT
jgi:protein tyrosine phosphatase (PTP) superfamily phosphohydrolase (DUF442 family)